METILYHPEFGYYSTTDAAGDYYTNADVHPIFGKILARFFCEEWKKNFKNEEKFTLIELGPGSGKLARAVLQYLSSESRDFFNAVRYIGVERSRFRRALCKKMNAEFSDRTEFIEDFNLKPRSVRGIIFSNEFFDALPFHRVVTQKNRIFEIYVGDSFKETTGRPAQEVQDYFKWLNVKPHENCRGEAHLEAQKWVSKIASSLERGTLLTIDYGFPVGELYSEFRTEGTALCHYLHETNRNFYENLGLQDMTSHINFTLLEKEAEKWGVKSRPLITQSRFLLDTGMDEVVRAMQSTSNPQSRLKTSSAVKSLIHPEGMGGVFKVLIQRRIG